MKDVVYVIKEKLVEGVIVQEEAIIRTAAGGWVLRKRLNGKYQHFTISKDEALEKISKHFKLDAGE